jgi:hypothetical protein
MEVRREGVLRIPDHAQRLPEFDPFALAHGKRPAPKVGQDDVEPPDSMMT